MNHDAVLFHPLFDDFLHWNSTNTNAYCPGLCSLSIHAARILIKSDLCQNINIHNNLQILFVCRTLPTPPASFSSSSSPWLWCSLWSSCCWSWSLSPSRVMTQMLLKINYWQMSRIRNIVKTTRLKYRLLKNLKNIFSNYFMFNYFGNRVKLL